ncbi:DUF4190 domain-containing protein [archaeon]|jgi:uncharacterized membrane protein|nr:DUF4190 domain-containing protein [archaeon]MBT3720327.1 DUF4190 domain-containing protein [archaeon]MBT4022981.1 DUF4190 domain-containing protein [archaeon]MBT4271972.1 DUF4190 domain-containing protein [archaeon]MBT4461810.1 DUF4190 domain-containing protein [archaeon]
MAIIAFVSTFVVPLLGLILGFIAIGQIKKSGEKGKGFAIAAIVINLIGVLVMIAFFGVGMVAYFGMLDPARMLPERCQSTAGMDCIDRAAVSTSGVVFPLRNKQSRF